MSCRRWVSLTALPDAIRSWRSPGARPTILRRAGRTSAGWRRNNPPPPAEHRLLVWIGGIGTEEAQDVTFGISGDDRVQHLLPAIGAANVAVPHGAAFQHAELVE